MSEEVGHQLTFTPLQQQSGADRSSQQSSKAGSYGISPASTSVATESGSPVNDQCVNSSQGEVDAPLMTRL